MVKMLFSSQQPEVTIKALPDGKRDVTVLANEEIVVVENLSEPTEPKKEMMYQYDGNQFRTVYTLTEEEILAEKKKYLEYSTDGEPTSEQLKAKEEIIKEYEESIMKQISEVVNND